MGMQDAQRYEIDHVDIITSHICNRRCEHCIDAFLNTSKDIVSLHDIEAFLGLVSEYCPGKKTVLLLGGEPTVLPVEKLEEIAGIIHAHGHKASMSTNGILMDRIERLSETYDSIQITIDALDEIEKWRHIADKVNLKICGDDTLTLDKLDEFAKAAADFQRRLLTMYFDENTFEELCGDEQVWRALDALEWKRNGSYLYSFYRGVRVKRCIPGETNVIDEPTIPKLYPNGNYNKSWRDEKLDDYLSVDGVPWAERRRDCQQMR